MLIAMTQEDLQAGVRQECLLCPVALMMLRVTGQRWMVGSGSAYRIGAKGWRAGDDPLIQLPLRMITWISMFDSGDEDRVLEPIEIDLDYRQAEVEENGEEGNDG